MATDALSAHARDELGLGERGGANALLAAFASAVSFSTGAALPTLIAFLVPLAATVAAVPAASLVFLAALGALSAWLGGAPPLEPTSDPQSKLAAPRPRHSEPHPCHSERSEEPAVRLHHHCPPDSPHCDPARY